MAVDYNELKRISSQTLANRISETAARSLKAPPKLTLSQWADTYRMLPPESCATPGKWRTDRAEYQREILDAAGDPQYEEVAICTSAQVGKTELITNMIFYHVHGDPSPILLVQPSAEMGRAYSKTKLSPSIRDTPAVASLFQDEKTRDKSNTILSKTFPGGVLDIVGSNSAANLASRSVRILLFDEVDKAPPSAGDEGDPVYLATLRTSNFYNRKVILCSTPKEDGASRIWAKYLISDQRKYYIKCVNCEHYFVPLWKEHVKWQKAEDGKYLPETALLHCPSCNHGHTDTERHAAVKKGQWIKHNPESKIAGFQLSAMLSPWTTLSSLVEKFLEAVKSPQTLKAFITGTLGEAFIEQGDTISDIDFLSRLEEYSPADLPNSIVVLAAGVDVQKDRIEASVYGRGVDNEFWHVEHHIIHGSPANPAIWTDLDRYLKTRFKRSDGYVLPIAAACIDSGGLFTQEAYNFCSNKVMRRWYAIKGASGNRPIWPARASKTKKGTVYIVGVDTAKEAIYEWLRTDTPGPGYVHFPDTSTVDFFEQLTAEKRVLEYRKGFPHYVWKKKDDARNETLDCFVYALAAFESLNVSVAAHKKKQASRLETKVEVPSEKLNKKPDPIKPDPIPTDGRKLPAWKQNILNKTRPGKRWR